MEDLSGRLSILSGVAFASGDGLVNSNEYLHRYLIPGRVGDYLRDFGIGYVLTSNIQCEPFRKRMPWTRDIEWDNGTYRVTVDVSYLTHLPVKPSVLYFSPADLRMDKCSHGIRALLFEVR